MSEATPSSVRLDILDGPIALLTSINPAAGQHARPGGPRDLEAAVKQVQLVPICAASSSAAASRNVHRRRGSQGTRRRQTRPALTRKLVQRGLNLVAAFESLPCPTVAAIDGACMGGGLELALGFDIASPARIRRRNLGSRK